MLCSRLQRVRAEHGAVLLRHLQPVGRPAGARHLPLPLLQPVPRGEGPGHRRLPLHGLQHLHAPHGVPHAQVPRPRSLPRLHGRPLRLLPSLQSEHQRLDGTCALPCTHGQSCGLKLLRGPHSLQAPHHVPHMPVRALVACPLCAIALIATSQHYCGQKTELI